jgi:hypothetical protein
MNMSISRTLPPPPPQAPETLLADARLIGKPSAPPKASVVPPWPEDIAVRRPKSRVIMAPQAFERRMYEFAQQFADPNASSATRYEIEKQAVGLLHDQGYTWNRVTNREFSRVGSNVFLPYIERVMGYVPIMPGTGYSFANGWQISEERNPTNNQNEYRIFNRGRLVEVEGASYHRAYSLPTDQWYAYSRNDRVYVALKGSKPNGKDGVALELRLSADKPLVNPPSVARNETGRRIEALLNSP